MGTDQRRRPGAKAATSGEASQTSQWRRRNVFSLHQDLKPLSHPFGVDQRLELQSGFRALRFGLPFIVEVGKFISLPQRQKKGCLWGESGGLQAGPFSPGFEGLEIAVRR